ncbi:hypothetical protein AKO1_013679 [Acrasis kona]|uniref:Uncharacterized protein n=1 Tax=Acrasis kona TaxID=1008807 RepID=A0AAW2YUD1_9EUKA
MSGGSRCNVLPHESKWPSTLDDLENKYFSSSPKILGHILSKWSIPDQVQFFEEELKIPLSVEEETGKYFPSSNDARDVLDGFLKKIRYTTNLVTSADVKDVCKTSDGRFRITYNKDEEILTDRVIMASGGISVINDDGTGYLLLQKLGHNLQPLYAALTPLTSTEESKAAHKSISGVSVERAVVSAFVGGECVYTSYPSALLFTHRGYSGPAILNTSHNVIVDKQFVLNQTSTSHIKNLLNKDLSGSIHLEIWWTPNISRDQWHDKFKYSVSSQTVQKFVQNNSYPNNIPARLASLILGSLADVPCNKLTAEQIESVLDLLCKFKINIGGNEGFKKAEVTGGGVDLTQINPDTLESTQCKGLYIVGEALDAFGCIGGFNFALAWITGRIAAEAALSSLK